MTAALLLALAQVPAQPAAPAFHPVEGAVYRCDTRETIVDPATTQQYHTSRRIVFHREGDGYLAEMTLDQVDQSGPGIGPAFLGGNAPLRNVAVRIHLDAHGAVVAVDDADTLIARIADGVESAARKSESPARAAAMAAPLRAFGAEQRRAVLGSTVADLIRLADIARPDGTRAVTLPPRPPMLAGAGLPGTETVSHAGDTLSIATHAAGPIAVGGPTVPGAATGSIAVDMLRRVDSPSGLVIENRSARTIGTAGSAQTSRSETIVTLRLESKTP